MLLEERFEGRWQPELGAIFEGSVLLGEERLLEAEAVLFEDEEVLPRGFLGKFEAKLCVFRPRALCLNDCFDCFQ